MEKQTWKCYDVYNDSIVRKMIECVWVRDDNKIEVIFAGGYTVEERIAENMQNKRIQC